MEVERVKAATSQKFIPSNARILQKPGVRGRHDLRCNSYRVKDRAAPPRLTHAEAGSSPPVKNIDVVAEAEISMK